MQNCRCIQAYGHGFVKHSFIGGDYLDTMDFVRLQEADMWFFGKKDKDKKDQKAAPAKVAANKPMTEKEAKGQELLAMMRSVRAEIGEENLQQIVRKLKLDDLKKQVKSDIDNDPHKRERLLDAIRYEMHDADRTTRH